MTEKIHITLCRFAKGEKYIVMEQSGTYDAAYDHVAEHLSGPHSAEDIIVLKVDAVTDITAEVLAKIETPATGDADWAYEPTEEGPGWHDV